MSAKREFLSPHFPIFGPPPLGEPDLSPFGVLAWQENSELSTWRRKAPTAYDASFILIREVFRVTGSVWSQHALNVEWGRPSRSPASPPTVADDGSPSTLNFPHPPPLSAELCLTWLRRSSLLAWGPARVRPGHFRVSKIPPVCGRFIPLFPVATT